MSYGLHRKAFGSSDLCICMSDAAGDDFGFLGEQLLKKSQTRPLRQEMEEFVDDHDVPGDLKTLRERVQSGEDASKIVIQQRCRSPKKWRR